MLQVYPFVRRHCRRLSSAASNFPYQSAMLYFLSYAAIPSGRDRSEDPSEGPFHFPLTPAKRTIDMAYSRRGVETNTIDPEKWLRWCRYAHRRWCRNEHLRFIWFSSNLQSADICLCAGTDHRNQTFRWSPIYQAVWCIWKRCGGSCTRLHDCMEKWLPVDSAPCIVLSTISKPCGRRLWAFWMLCSGSYA